MCVRSVLRDAWKRSVYDLSPDRKGCDSGVTHLEGAPGTRKEHIVLLRTFENQDGQHSEQKKATENRMNLALVTTFLCIIRTASLKRQFPSCGQQRTIITALDNSTCIPRYYKEFQEEPGPCTSSVHVVTNCTCQDGNYVSGTHYCVRNVYRTDDDNTVNVTIGLCGPGGSCHTYFFKAHMEVDVRDVYIAHTLQAYARPACKANNISVTTGLKAAMGCEYYCYGRKNRDINDGRPCVYEWYKGFISKAPVITLTGSCNNGICKAPDTHSVRKRGVCHDLDRYKNHNEPFNVCYYTCPNKSQRARPDNLTCLFSKTTFLRRDIVGICKGGTCTPVVEVDGCTANNRRTSPTPIVKKCLCKKRGTITYLTNGRLCAVAYSLGINGKRLRRVGICDGGKCVDRPPDRPAPHKFQRKECKTVDVQVTPQLKVAGGCSATCRRYEIEPRQNGILCLLQYKRETVHLVRRKETYTIGECWNGKCVYTENSWVITL